MPSNVDFAHAAPGCTGVDPQHPAAAQLSIVDADAGKIDWFGTGRKKIALCGFASSSRHRMPLNDPAWIICGLNQLYRHIERADVWFDIHAYWRDDNVEGTDHPKWLAECGIPVFMTQREPSIPTAVRHPNDELIKYFGLDYSTSTVAHMLQVFIWAIDADVRRRLQDIGAHTLKQNGDATALDVFELARTLYGEYEIGIFGIDLVVGTEYEVQRQCAEFWIGAAEARGITMTIPPESALLKQTHRYGYQREPLGHPFKLGEMDKRRAQLAAKRAQLVATLQTLDGALQESEMWTQIGGLRVRGADIGVPEA